MKNINISIIVMLTALVIILLISDCSNMALVKKYKNKYESQLLVLDTVTHYKDKYGRAVSKIGVLEVQNAKQVLEIKSDKEIVKYLQSEVKKYKSQKPEIITVVEERVKFDTIIETDSVIVYTDSAGNKEVEYVIDFNGPWVYLYGKVNSKTSDISIELDNKYSVAFIKNKRTKKMEVFVTNENPYCEISEMLAYKVTIPKPKNFGVGVLAGYGINLVNAKPAPFIGIGISYNLFKF
jgi:hypothetical protein